MVTITDEMLNALAVPLWGEMGMAAAHEGMRAKLREGLNAAAALIEAAALRSFATELMRERDRVECADPSSPELLGEYHGHKAGLEQAADWARTYGSDQPGSGD